MGRQQARNRRRRRAGCQPLKLAWPSVSPRMMITEALTEAVDDADDAGWRAGLHQSSSCCPPLLSPTAPAPPDVARLARARRPPRLPPCPHMVPWTLPSFVPPPLALPPDPPPWSSAPQAAPVPVPVPVPHGGGAPDGRAGRLVPVAHHATPRHVADTADTADAAALPHAHPPTPAPAPPLPPPLAVPPQSLSTTRLTAEQAGHPSGGGLDLLTGFHAVDGHERIVVVEGLAEGAMKLVKVGLGRLGGWAVGGRWLGSPRRVLSLSVGVEACPAARGKGGLGWLVGGAPGEGRCTVLLLPMPPCIWRGGVPRRVSPRPSRNTNNARVCATACACACVCAAAAAQGISDWALYEPRPEEGWRRRVVVLNPG